MVCEIPICSFTIDKLSFSIYDSIGNEIIEPIENTLIFIKGITSYGNKIYITDNRNNTNIAYGITDTNGNFNIPIYLNGIDNVDEIINLLVTSTI